MPAKKIDRLLEILAASLLELGGRPLFANHTDLYSVIDSARIGEVKWENFTLRYKASEGDEEQNAPWMFDTYDVWYRDPRQVIHNLLGSAEFAEEMDYVPYREYDAKDDTRRWQDFMSGDWAWSEAVHYYLYAPISDYIMSLG